MSIDDSRNFRRERRIWPVWDLCYRLSWPAAACGFARKFRRGSTAADIERPHVKVRRSWFGINPSVILQALARKYYDFISCRVRPEFFGGGLDLLLR